MHELMKTKVNELTLEELSYLNELNNLHLHLDDLILLHHLIKQQWHNTIIESTLSLNEEFLKNYVNVIIISKYKELITSIKWSIIENYSF